MNRIGDQREVLHLVQFPSELATAISNQFSDARYLLRLHLDSSQVCSLYNPYEVGCVVLFNWSSGSESLDTVRRLCDRPAPARVVLLVSQPDVYVSCQAAKLGAQCVLASNVPVDRLAEEIRTQLKSDAARRDELIANLEAVERLNSLTVKEANVMREMLAGHSNKVIASRLDIAIRTVESRRKKIFEKSGFQTLALLAAAVARLDRFLEVMRAPAPSVRPAPHAPIAPSQQSLLRRILSDTPVAD